MATTEYVLESLADIEHHIRLLSATNGAEELIGAVTNYLESWSKERIEGLQKIDGGWGTFDNHQRPQPIHAIEDISWIAEALKNHCWALKEAQLDPSPELLELELYFALAMQIAESRDLGRLKSRGTPRTDSGDRRWTGRPKPSGIYANGVAGF